MVGRGIGADCGRLRGGVLGDDGRLRLGLSIGAIRSGYRICKNFVVFKITEIIKIRRVLLNLFVNILYIDEQI